MGGCGRPEAHGIGVVIIELPREERLQRRDANGPVPAVALTQRHAPGVLADLAPLKAVARLPDVVLEADGPKPPRRARHAIGLADPAAAGPLGDGRFRRTCGRDVLGDREAAARAGVRAIGHVLLAVGTSNEHGARGYHALVYGEADA